MLKESPTYSIMIYLTSLRVMSIVSDVLPGLGRVGWLTPFVMILKVVI